MRPTVACVLVRGNVDYTAEYVTRLRLMVRRHLRRDHRFVCLTDQPEKLPDDVETIRVRHSRDLPGWWAKIELFNPAHHLGDRVLYLDLDVLVVSSLDAVMDYSSPFALVPPAGTFSGRGALRVVRKYNSSVMVWNNTAHVHMLHHLWSSSVALRLWGDQDYIGEVLPAETTMPLSWFPRLSEIECCESHAVLSTDAKVVLCKKPKNHEAMRKYSWFSGMWS